MKKRIAVLGKGTAGSQAVIHYLKNATDCEIQWYFDSNIPTQSVGEGSTIALPDNLFKNINLNYLDFDKIDATLKLGIYKSGWGKTGKDFFHLFPLPATSMHFNAVALQDYIYEHVKDKVSIFDLNVKSSDVDADYIMDCSGKPDSYDLFHKSSYIPVNSAFITQCDWEYPRFQYTLTIARPYGWVFGIPLKNRCSIGYLFNKDINDIEDIKEDVKNVFLEYNLHPSIKTRYLEFDNYYRKINYTERVIYNGNSSFFLEPLEATSIALMSLIQKDALDVWSGKMTLQDANDNYQYIIHQIETMIMLHYFAGSKYDTQFWRYAQMRGTECIDISLKYDNNFREILEYAVDKQYANYCDTQLEYGTWWSGSFCDNLRGLGLFLS
jgi:hypothetical protein